MGMGEPLDNYEHVVEACRACGGTGRLAPPRVDVIKSRVLDHRLFELVLGKQGFLVSAFDSVGNYLHHFDAPPDCIIVGWFFRNRRENDERSEVLVFITPKITNKGFLRCE